MSPEILVIDLETTSTNPQRADILEVALASANLDTGTIGLLIDTLICPACPEEDWLECWFMVNSKLAPDLIRRAPKFATIRPGLEAHLQRLAVTAFNSGYDLQVLHEHRVHAAHRAPCLMLTCKDILRLPGYYGDWKYPKFSEAWSYFFPDEPFEEKHRAGWDALHEARLAVALYAQGFLPLLAVKQEVKHDAQARLV